MGTAYGTYEGINVLAKNLVRDLQNMAGDLGTDTKKVVMHITRNVW